MTDPTATCWLCNGTRRVRRKLSPTNGDRDARKRLAYAYGDGIAFENAEEVECPECKV